MVWHSSPRHVYRQYQCMIMYIMGVVLKVHVRVFTVIAMAAGFQHKTPRKFFLSARKHVFWAKDLAKDFNMRPSRKINLGFAKDSRKYFLFAKNGRLQIKEFRTTAIYIYYIIDINMYIYIIYIRNINMYNIYIYTYIIDNIK